MAPGRDRAGPERQRVDRAEDAGFCIPEKQDEVTKLENQPFRFTFNGLLKVAVQGSQVTSDAGLAPVRELDG